MHIDNGTQYQAGFTSALDKEGREHVVLVVKGSFDFPSEQGGVCQVSGAQSPLIMADEFWGEPGHSAPKTEMDFAHVKSRCDVLLEASAYAPGGRPVERVRAGVRLGGWSKVLDVVGNRVWLSGPVGLSISDVQPFVNMPITYDRAFGGVDRSDPELDPLPAYLANPVGKGWHRMENLARLTGQPLPNFEFPDRDIEQPWNDYPAMSLGPMGRGWPARLRFAGTYDQSWIDDVFPFLPADFDPQYYQAAPEDQQIPYPVGGETVTLVNLTQDGNTSFKLPSAEMPVLFSRRRADDISLNAALDTISIRPDDRHLSLTWRASIPIERDIFEVTECIVGPRTAAFWRARRLGKTYYPSLKALPKKEPVS